MAAFKTAFVSTLLVVDSSVQILLKFRRRKNLFKVFWPSKCRNNTSLRENLPQNGRRVKQRYVFPNKFPDIREVWVEINNQRGYFTLFLIRFRFEQIALNFSKTKLLLCNPGLLDIVYTVYFFSPRNYC